MCCCIAFNTECRALDKERFSCSKLPYMTSKTYVVGTQKNLLSETIHLSTHNIGFNDC